MIEGYRPGGALVQPRPLHLGHVFCLSPPCCGTSPLAITLWVVGVCSVQLLSSHGLQLHLGHVGVDHHELLLLRSMR